MRKDDLHILQIGDVLVSPDIITEFFCCDLAACHGACCIEGDAGAPVTMDEVGLLEDAVDEVWNELTAQAQSVVDRQGVVYVDVEHDLVTSIVNGRDCAFACHENGICLCALDRAYRQGRTAWPKPISCALYPIREKRFATGIVGINYHQWDICRPAIAKGKAEGLRVYQFLKQPLITRFGAEWYGELCEVAEQILKELEE